MRNSGEDSRRAGVSSGLRMPGEYEEHEGTIMIWPAREGSFPDHAKEARKTFAEIAGKLAAYEKVYLLTDPASEKPPVLPGVTILPVPTDDAWARDVCPTFIKDEEGFVYGIDWEFNAWGGEYDGLYSDYERDNACAAAVCACLNYPVVSARPFVLEGGSVHSDGEGTLLCTEECLLSPGRNPELSKDRIEEKLKSFLGVEKVIWLPFGILGDETNGHVDNFCAFTAPGEAVLAWTDEEGDPQFERCRAALKVLGQEKDARGRRIRVTKLPLPEKKVCIRKDELGGFVYEEGEKERTEGEVLAASYVNFYIANGCVLIPQFGDVNDKKAVEILSECFPDRKMIPVQTRSVLLGGGNIHCITQQIPAGFKSAPKA